MEMAHLQIEMLFSKKSGNRSTWGKGTRFARGPSAPSVMALPQPPHLPVVQLCQSLRNLLLCY